MTSRVEERALAAAARELIYPPREKIGVIVVDSFPALGTLAAMRFVEWVQHNPEGVIALPTGKTPEYFIREVGRLLRGWKQKAIQHELVAWGVDPKTRFDVSGLHFVQIDEFYPIEPSHENSFHHYVNRYYIDGWGLDRDRALLIDGTRIGLPPRETLESIWPDGRVDLSLRYRLPGSRHEELQRDVLQQVDEWCTEYEQRVRALGGLGFFLGGIGPDGHIGFNVRGSDLYSTTRLTEVNYETQAAAATDLGGIEVARNRLVITIGLATITHNPDCTAIVIAAGEAKAGTVREAIESERHIRYPASALQVLPGARFYLTRGAAKQLESRQLVALTGADHVDEHDVEKIVIDLSLATGKRLDQLRESDFRAHRLPAALLGRAPGSPREMCDRVAARLRQKIEAGTRVERDAVFLHTEPHHDDLILGCMPYIVRHIRVHSTTHFFTTFTSGFTAVTNAFMLRQLRKLDDFTGSVAFAHLDAAGYFDPSDAASRNADVWRYLDGVAADSRAVQDDAEMRRLYRNLLELHADADAATIRERIAELIAYFESAYPGKKDPAPIQQLKGMCREWEAECLWGYFGWKGESVRHLRLGFYTGEIFTGEPTLDRDVAPVVKLLREVNPDVVTLALDPEASGPDTHYKVLQATSEALRLHEEATGRDNITVLGYRNVWYRFHPAEADVFVPVSLNMFALQQSAFLHTFISQKDASFPSYEHDGPFSELAQKIQVDQYRMITTCLGREFFDEHPSALIRATRGFVFLKRMTTTALRGHSRELRRSTENT
ncbi:MAG TPA: glucosamine-6-phosphate deaminase [Candidatus Krumholzibacteria bacterium]